jgi:hypothetical protein
VTAAADDLEEIESPLRKMTAQSERYPEGAHRMIDR